jgi:5-methylcytosine-specific restriction endonuclease McrA
MPPQPSIAGTKAGNEANPLSLSAREAAEAAAREVAAVPLLRLCPSCGKKIPVKPHTKGKCSACLRANERERSRRRRTDANVQVRGSAAWQALTRVVHARDVGCVRVHEGGCAGILEVHHIVPLSRGGTNALGNLALLCRKHHSDSERAFFRQTTPDPSPRSRKKLSSPARGGEPPSVG